MKEILISYIRDELLDGRIYADLKEDDDLLTSGLVDSLGMMTLVTFIEETIGIRVPPEDVTLESFSTITQIVSATDAELLGVIEQKIAELELTLKNNSPSPFPKVIKRSSGWGR